MDNYHQLSSTHLRRNYSMNKHLILFTLAIVGLATQPLCAMLAIRRTAKIQKPVYVEKRLKMVKIHPMQSNSKRLFPYRKTYPHHYNNHLKLLQPTSALLQACEENKSEECALVKNDLNHFFHDVTTLGILMTISDACFIKTTIENILPHLSAEERNCEFNLVMNLYEQLYEECPLSSTEKSTNNMLRHPAIRT